MHNREMLDKPSGRQLQRQADLWLKKSVRRKEHSRFREEERRGRGKGVHKYVQHVHQMVVALTSLPLHLLAARPVPC